MDEKKIRDSVKERYGEIARQSQGETGGHSSCCGGVIDPFDLIKPQSQSTLMGYSEEEIASVPLGAVMGLGCGNPQAIAALQPGEVVLDLGSGAGFDSFLAAQRIGDEGKVIGVAATLKSTMEPTCRLIEKKAKDKGKKINIQRTLCPGAYDALLAGETDKHDSIVTSYVKELAGKVDVIVFAQSTMARLLDVLDKDLADMILTSPERGVKHAREILGLD